MNDHSITIRFAHGSDAEAIRDIYSPFIADTAVSFEAKPPTIGEMQSRIESVLAETPWLVAEQNGKILGYAYGGSHRARHAYRYTREVSVYLAPNARGKGLAKALYEVLLKILVRQGYCTAVAGLTLPNVASQRFHEKMGFELIGTYHRVGYKFGAFHDVMWMEKAIREAPPAQLLMLPDFPQAELDAILNQEI